ncbi:MAG: hypothetical protein K9I85_11240 [Saprospiraceae bacterium]|nr:hypothetical protein [Saprospiraceae bacterium]
MTLPLHENKKSRNLFQGRQIDKLYAMSPLMHDQTYYDRLVHLQSSIYDLDAFLESSWIIPLEELNKYWEQIHASLASFHLNYEDRERMLRDVRVYQSHEMVTRTGGSPMNIPITEFYHFKTCDVRLIRHLIYQADPRLEQEIPESIWRYYDWMTEVQDDLEDQEEDKGTYNVNRYLHAVDHFGEERARSHYLSYVRHISSAAGETLQEESFPLREEYLSWLQEAGEKIRILL